MNLESVESVIHWLGGLLAYTTLGFVFYGLWRGTRRPVGLTTGLTGKWLRSLWFYLLTSILFFALCIWGWKPLPLTMALPIRSTLLALGSLLYFPCVTLVLWARLALGKNYFASTGLGVQLFAGHQLVTRGPFAIVRHTMYVGLILSAFGSLLIYHTWTTLCFACFVPFILVRARREETALAMEFGENWREYCTRVPPFIPRLKR